MKKKSLIIIIAISVAVVVGLIFLLCVETCKDNNKVDSSSSSSNIDEQEPQTKNEPKISVNQDNVILTVGDEFTLVAQAGEVENAKYDWKIDGNCDQSVISIQLSENRAVIKAEKVGDTKIVVTITIEDEVYFRVIDVTIKESDGVSIVLSSVGFDKNGYHIDLSTLTTDKGDKISVSPRLTAYKNNKVVGATDVKWESKDENIVKVEGNSIKSVSEGNAKVVGSCKVDGNKHTFEISVTIYRPTIELDCKQIVEIENLKPIVLSGDFKGVSQGITYNGEAVGSFNSQTKNVEFDKDKIPKNAKELGENRQFIIETTLARYTFKADIYTKIINNKSDFDSLAEISKANGNGSNVWDGYYILADDIEYNGLFENRIADLSELAKFGDWYNGCLYGFKGVFDGKGHVIDGLRIENGNQMAAVFGVLHVDGVVKNLSFTNASVSANSALVCGAGGGSVENIFVQYASMGEGAQFYQPDGSINDYCSTFFSFKEPLPTATVTNCVIDVSGATLNTRAALKLACSELVTMKNVIVVGGDTETRNKSNATASCGSIAEFIGDKKLETLFGRFNNEFWATDKGVPISRKVYDRIKNNTVSFSVKPTVLVTGTEYKFLLNNNYVDITSDSECLTITNGVGKISAEAENGKEITLTATSLFDQSIKDSIKCKIIAVSNTQTDDLTDGKKSAFYDITLDKVYTADFEIESPILYYVNSDFSAITFGKEDDEAKNIIAVTENKFYKITCKSVTKVIEKATDLNYIRRDYTVTSYGNQGKYDGKILGTFVMINDIDCAGLVLKDSGNYWENSRGFGGTFDGRGYTINNLSVGKNGLFGSIAYATIKNVNFTNVKLIADKDGSGAYVSLLSARAFNSVVDNVNVEFAQTVSSEQVYHTSGLLCYETTFDCVFSNIKLDISKTVGVKFIAEAFYESELPYLSVNKSIYENIEIIMAEGSEIPVFAYKLAKGGDADIVDYPVGVTITQKNSAI